MSTPVEDHAEVRRRFRLAKIMTMARLMTLLACSRSTVQRRLRKWGCHTSCNLNGRFYALPDVVQFDARGLWRCGEALFSVHGNLRRTVSALVEASEAGMSAAELSAVLEMNANSFLWGFVQGGAIARQQFEGGFVYLSTDLERREQQCERRCGGDGSLADADAVRVLVELVKSPNASASQLVARVRARAPTVSVEAIERFFTAHGLNPAKKGASDSARSGCSPPAAES